MIDISVILCKYWSVRNLVWAWGMTGPKGGRSQFSMLQFSHCSVSKKVRKRSLPRWQPDNSYASVGVMLRESVYCQCLWVVCVYFGGVSSVVSLSASVRQVPQRVYCIYRGPGRYTVTQNKTFHNLARCEPERLAFYLLWDAEYLGRYWRNVGHGTLGHSETAAENTPSSINKNNINSTLKKSFNIITRFLMI